MKQGRTYELIGKELKGEASSTEIRILSDWKEKDTTNARLYHQVSSVWEKYRLISMEVKVDVLTAWDRLERKIETEVSDTRQNNIFRWSWKVAASILMVSLFAFLLYQVWDDVDEHQLTTTEFRSDPLILDDGSTVWLSRNSTLYYPEIFDTDTRVVRLSGEAYFEIKPNKNKPFIVQSDHGTEALVVGTAFNYFTSSDSSLLSVTEGVVRFTADDSEIVLQANEEGIFNNDHLEKRPTTDLNLLAWKTGILQFDRTPLHEVVAILADHYDVDIVLEVQQQEWCKLISYHDNQELSDVLNVVTSVLGLEWKQQADGRYILRGTGCQ